MSTSSTMGSSDPLRFGVILPSFGSQAGRLAMLDLAHVAEDLGFESVWTTDHIGLPEADAGRFGHIFEALTALGYLAASTSRVRLGVSALVLPQRDPLLVAKQVATLDVLSGGRVDLAVGAGWSAGEFANLGQAFDNRGARLDEGIKVLRTLWRGSKVVSFAGEFYRFERLYFSPGPLQAGGPPLWVAGNSPRAQRRAVLLADGWHPTGLSCQALSEAMATMRPLLGGRPFTICLRLGLSFSPSGENSSPLAGTPEEIAAQLRAYQAAGMNYALLDFAAGTPSAAAAARLQAMRRFCREVLPLLPGG